MKIPEKPHDLNEILKAKRTEIGKLLENKEIMKHVANYNREYVHWEQLRRKDIVKNVDPEAVWALIKVIRQNRQKILKIGDEKFRYVLTDEIFKRLHMLDKGSAGRLESTFEFINREGKERYVISSLMEEAIASSQLEGANTTRRLAKEMLRKNKKPRNYSEKMIVNGYITMQNILKMKNKELTPELILEVQKSITTDTLKNKEDEGKFRDNNEIVVGDAIDIEKIFYTPPDYKKIPELIEDLCKFANSDIEEFIHPIIKGIILHFLIGYIHPFNDGNGRTARSIFYWYVLSKGYWLFEFMAISRILLRSKVEYGLSYLYTETDNNDLTYFINYNLNAIEEALHDTENYIAGKQKEQEEVLKIIKTLKVTNTRQANILRELMKEPDKVFSIKEIMNTYGVVYQTARADMLYLSRKNYIEKLKIGKKFGFKIKRTNLY